ncbi:MAG: hypothetical protein NTZ05_19625 [Chloroflexi bacterium]|nr:hypothetical protein [Chloroflexota bacterium]
MTTTRELEKLIPVTPEDAEQISSQGFRFALAMVRQYGHHSTPPEDATTMDDAAAAALVDAFRLRLRQNPSAGDIAENLADLVIYVMGTSPKLTARQREWVTALCDTVGERPLPALRWAEFIRSNLETPERIRLVLIACKRSMHALAGRLTTVIASNARRLHLLHQPSIVAVGYSKTIVAAIQGVAKASDGPVTVYTPEIRLPGKPQAEHELLQQELTTRESRVTVISLPISQLFDELAAHNVNAAFMGCKVLARAPRTAADGTRSFTVEAVNSRLAAQIGRRLREEGIPLIVVAGLYKIWPTAFYEQHRTTGVLGPAFKGRPLNDVLDERNIDWILTERGCFRTATFMEAEVTAPYFDDPDFVTPCVLSACADNDLKAMIKRYNRGDRAPHPMIGVKNVGPNQLSVDALRAEREAAAVEERERYAATGELPEHFTEAREYFEQLLLDDAWYAAYHHQYVALMGQTVIDEDADRVALLQRLYRQYGRRPLYTGHVTREQSALRLRPRTAATLTSSAE